MINFSISRAISTTTLNFLIVLIRVQEVQILKSPSHFQYFQWAQQILFLIIPINFKTLNFWEFDV